MAGNVDRAIWPDLVARAIRNAALATPGLERVFVLGLVGWLQVELLLHFRELEALNRWDHIRRPFSLAGAHARPTEANKRKERNHREKSLADAHKLPEQPRQGHFPAIQRARNASQ